MTMPQRGRAPSPTHVVLAVGGRVERFFILWPWLWFAYVAGLMLGILLAFIRGWSPPGSDFPETAFRVVAVGVTAVLLAPAWTLAAANAPVLHAFAERGYMDSINASALAQYLGSRNPEGRWRTGVRLGSAYSLFFVLWALVAVYFPALTGIRLFEAFLAVDVVVVVALLGLFIHSANRLFKAVRDAGFPMRALRKFPFLRLPLWNQAVAPPRK